MKKGLVVVIVLVLVAVGYFYYTKMKSGGIVGTGAGVTSGVKSLKDLIAAGVPQKCTFSSSEESGATEGTTYVSGGSVRGDFASTVSGKSTVSHMISDGKTSYIWVDEQKTGFKMTVSETSATPTAGSGESATNTEGDLNKTADYKCSAWIPDNSLFTPPSDVKFSDFSQMVQPSAMPAGIQNTSSQCSYCNTLSGDDKTQCLSALNCQ